MNKTPQIKLLNSSIVLKDTFEEIPNWIVEKIILCRWSAFKNNPRVNYLLFKSLWTTVVIFLFTGVILFLMHKLFYNEEICTILSEFHPHILTITSSFMATISLIYWNSAGIFHKKWAYCSGLYNEIIKFDSSDAKESKKKDILSNALAIDLVMLDLWAHRSFREFFRDELEGATGAVFPKNCDIIVFKINNNEMTEKEALKILNNYQNLLL